MDGGGDDTGRAMEGIGKMIGGFAPVLDRLDYTPWQIAGRMVGLGKSEMAAGVPKWAWGTIGLVGGVTVMWVFGDRIKGWVRRDGK